MEETERLARQTRNATVFIAWLLGLGVAFGFVLGLVFLVQSLPVTPSYGGPVETHAPRLCEINPTYAC